MATYIFDFDDTLFDNQKLKKDIFKILKNNKLNKEEITQSYLSVRHDYSFENHINHIKSNYPKVDSKKIKNELKSINLENHLSKYTEEVLNQIKNEHNLILITYGNLKFQKEKLYKTGIKRFFKKELIFITNTNKIEILNKIEISEETYFLNDKEEENKIIKQKFKKLKVVKIDNKNHIKKAINKIKKGEK